MASSVITYFIDTNVLVQCHPLDQLDWRAVTDADEVMLIVSRPIQVEIDNHKNNGGNRVAKRARKASTLIREVILSDTNKTVIRAADPVVEITVDVSLQPTADLSDQLNYTLVDDQLVGIAHAYASAHPAQNAHILTHDTGPMAIAKMVDVDIAVVPDIWLLPPEPSLTDRKLRQMEAELSKLKDREPSFTIECLDDDENSVERLVFEVVLYEPMTEAEVSAVMDSLRQTYPLETDFGPTQSSEEAFLGTLNVMRAMQTFTPPNERQISRYRAAHGKWLETCQDVFNNLHDALFRRYGSPEFVFSIRNDGARPAEDAWVTFEAKGKFEIAPPPYRDSDDELEDEDTSGGIRIPKPPVPPEGKWTLTALAGQSALEAMQNFQHNSALMSGPSPFNSGLLGNLERPEKDQNGFYYKPKRNSLAGQSFGLECKQWRQGVAAECFQGHIHVDNTSRDLSGAIECKIHAANLARPSGKTIPIRISFKREKASVAASRMMDELRS